MFLFVERDIAVEVITPTITDIPMVCHHEIHDIRKLAFRQFAPIACKYAPAITREPYFRCAGRWLLFRYMHMDRLAVLCSPKEDRKPLEEEESRHKPSTPPVRGGASTKHCYGRTYLDVSYLPHQSPRCRTIQMREVSSEPNRNRALWDARQKLRSSRHPNHWNMRIGCHLLAWIVVKHRVPPIHISDSTHMGKAPGFARAASKF